MDHSLFSASTMLMWSLPPDQWFHLAAEKELGGLELWIQQMDFLQIQAEEIRRLQLRYGTGLTIHSYSWDINLLSLCRDMRNMSVSMTKRAIDLASFLHAPYITVHPGRETIAIPGLDYDCLMAETADALSRYAFSHGTSLSFEIMEKVPGERYVSAAAVKYMETCRAPMRLLYTIDTAHCDSEEELFSLAADLEGKIAEFHISNKKGSRRHVADISAGDLDLLSILPHLSCYDRPFVLEGYDTSPDCPVLKHTLSYFDGK